MSSRRGTVDRRRRRATPLRTRAGPADDPAVLLPPGRRRARPDRRGRRRRRVHPSRAAWIAGAVLVGGLAAFALGESDWLGALAREPTPGFEAGVPADRPFGPGNLGLPPPGENPAPPPDGADGVDPP